MDVVINFYREGTFTRLNREFVSIRSGLKIF